MIVSILVRNTKYLQLDIAFLFVRQENLFGSPYSSLASSTAPPYICLEGQK